jgi:hypothetical protein
VSREGGSGLAGSCISSGTRLTPSRGDGLGADGAVESDIMPGVPTRAGDRFPGIGKENMESRSSTESSSGDAFMGDRGADLAESGDGICDPTLLAGVGTLGWRNAPSGDCQYLYLPVFVTCGSIRTCD